MYNPQGNAVPAALSAANGRSLLKKQASQMQDMNEDHHAFFLFLIRKNRFLPATRHKKIVPRRTSFLADKTRPAVSQYVKRRGVILFDF